MHATFVSQVDRLIEPRPLYSVGRVQRDSLGGFSNVGTIGTAGVRELDADAFTGGLDYNIRWGRNRYGWDGHWVGTRAPFADGQRTGFGGATRFNYSGKHLGILGHLDHFGPNFRNTDLGFHSARVNKTNVNGGVNLGQPDPWSIFRNISTFINAGLQRNGDGLVFERWIGTGAFMQLLNFWGVGGNVSHNSIAGRHASGFLRVSLSKVPRHSQVAQPDHLGPRHFR